MTDTYTGGRLQDISIDRARAHGLTETDIADGVRIHRTRVAKEECSRRIYDVASTEAQTNVAMEAAAAAAKTSTARTDDEKDLLARLQSWVDWVNAMRDTVATIAAEFELLGAAPFISATDIEADASWPDCPAEMADLFDRH